MAISNLKRFLKEGLPSDVDAAVAALAKFPFAVETDTRSDNFAERYWDAENEATEADTFAELHHLYLAGYLPGAVYHAFMKDYGYKDSPNEPTWRE